MLFNFIGLSLFMADRRLKNCTTGPIGKWNMKLSHAIDAGQGFVE